MKRCRQLEPLALAVFGRSTLGDCYLEQKVRELEIQLSCRRAACVLVVLVSLELPRVKLLD